MWLGMGLILAFCHLTLEQERNHDCPGRCRKCLEGVCISCTTGYYGYECATPCPPTCKTSTCDMAGSCEGCQSGWYGQVCNSRCGVHCAGPCDQIHGQCSYTSPHSCVVGVCTDYCKQYCISVNEDRVNLREKTVFGSEWVICIALTSIFLLVLCFFCLVRRGKNSRPGSSKETSFDVSLPSLGLHPGHQSTSFNSCSRSYSNGSLGNGCGDPDSVMTIPRHYQLSSDMEHNDVMSCVAHAEMPLPVCNYEKKETSILIHKPNDV